MPVTRLYCSDISLVIVQSKMIHLQRWSNNARNSIWFHLDQKTTCCQTGVLSIAWPPISQGWQVTSACRIVKALASWSRTGAWGGRSITRRGGWSEKQVVSMAKGPPRPKKRPETIGNQEVQPEAVSCLPDCSISSHYLLITLQWGRRTTPFRCFFTAQQGAGPGMSDQEKSPCVTS